MNISLNEGERFVLPMPTHFAYDKPNNFDRCTEVLCTHKYDDMTEYQLVQKHNDLRRHGLTRYIALPDLVEWYFRMAVDQVSRSNGFARESENMEKLTTWDRFVSIIKIRARQGTIASELVQPELHEDVVYKNERVKHMKIPSKLFDAFRRYFVRPDEDITWEIGEQAQNAVKLISLVLLTGSSRGEKSNCVSQPDSFEDFRFTGFSVEHPPHENVD